MNNPLKKPGPAPESYTPKETPAIISMAKKFHDKIMRRTPAMTVEPSIITRRFRLVGLEAPVDLKDEDWGEAFDALPGRLQEALRGVANVIEPVRPIGFWTGDPNADYGDPANHSKRMYFFGAEVTSLDGIPAGLVTKDFPESQFAVWSEEEHGTAPKWEWLEASKYSFNSDAIPGDFEINRSFGEINVPPWDILVPIREGK